MPGTKKISEFTAALTALAAAPASNDSLPIYDLSAETLKKITVDYLLSVLPGILNYAETVYAHGNVSGAVTIDRSNGGIQTMTVTGEVTLSLANFPAGKASSVVLDITNGGSAPFNWQSGATHPGGTPPSLTAAGLDRILVTTENAGAVSKVYNSGLDWS